jgi:hypothetical protein
MPSTSVTVHQRYVLVGALFLTLVLALASSIINPIFEPPDELQHYQYVRYLIDEKRLPVQTLDSEASQSHQPPLYFLATREKVFRHLSGPRDQIPGCPWWPLWR